MTSEHYKNTYNKLFNELPKWKQMAVKEDSSKNHWSGLLTDFIKNVIYTAENSYQPSVKFVEFFDKEPPKKKIRSKKS